MDWIAFTNIPIGHAKQVMPFYYTSEQELTPGDVEDVRVWRAKSVSRRAVTMKGPETSSGHGDVHVSRASHEGWPTGQ